MSYCHKHEDTMGIRVRDCPLCALEKRVEELANEIKKFGHTKASDIIQTGDYRIVPTSCGDGVTREKLYSGFTLKEWELMFKDGPLLVMDRRAVTHWVNGFEEKGEAFLCGNRPYIYATPESISLIEQPNWRPHRTDECPVPGRVRLVYKTKTGEFGPHRADSMNWYSGECRAYRIIGLEDK